ncbi:MAG: hypothetical protein QW304_07670 [Thermoproteota archaeon]
MGREWAYPDELRSVSCTRCGSRKLWISGKKNAEFEGIYDGERIVQETESNTKHYIHLIECAACKEDLTSELL